MKFNLLLAVGLLTLTPAVATSAPYQQQQTQEPVPEAPVPARLPSIKPNAKQERQTDEAKLVSDGDKPQTQDAPQDDSPIKFEKERGLDGGVIAIELSADGTVLASAGLNKDITLRSTKDFSVLANTKFPQGMVLDLMFTSNGKHLIACGDAKQVTVYGAEDLKTGLDYKIGFRPERIAETVGDMFVVGGRSGRYIVMSPTKSQTGHISVHKSFIGGLAASLSPHIVYSAGDQSDGPYFLSRRVHTVQKIVALPDRPSRVTMGKGSEEVLVATANHALRVDVVKKKVVDLWKLPDAKKVEDIIYWKQRDLYVTSDKSGFIKLWQRDNPDPVASHQVSKYDVYQVAALDDDRLIICGRQASPDSISIWNLSFDPEKFPKPQLAQENSDLVEAKPQTNGTEPGTKIEMPKVAAENVAPSPATESEPAKLTRLEPKPSPWVELNENFEVKRINPADLKLRDDLPSNKAELDWQITQLETANKPIPQSLKDFEPLQINKAIVSPGGKLFLATTDGLAQYDPGEGGASFVRDKDSKIVRAAGLARDPVDGILIGVEGENKVLELRESGKLVSRGRLDAAAQTKDETKDKAKMSVTQIVASGSDYLALSNDLVYRRLTDGAWEKESLHTESRPISKFALLETREIVTADPDSPDLTVHPKYGAASKVQVTQTAGHASNSSNILVDSGSDMRIKKMIPIADGSLFCAFVRTQIRNKEQRESDPFSDNTTVTAGACTLTGRVFDYLVTSNDLDWGAEGLPEKDRTVVDFLPTFSGEPKDVWFLTPDGVGLFVGSKTQFWKSEFKLDRSGFELQRFESLGDGSLLVYTSDGVHGEDVFYIRPKK